MCQVGASEQLHSLAAVLANICHEYVEFGNEAFNQNKLQALFIQHDGATYVAKPIYSLVLCFVCEKDANVGLIRSKVQVMSEILEESLASMQHNLSATNSQNTAAQQAADQ